MPPPQAHLEDASYGRTVAPPGVFSRTGCRSGRRRDHGVLVPGGVEVGVHHPQARRPEPFVQFSGREGAEPDRVLARLDPVAALEQERDMSDDLLSEAVRYLPGVQADAPAAV